MNMKPTLPITSEISLGALFQQTAFDWSFDCQPVITKARILKIFKKSRFSKEALKNQNKTKHFRFTVRYQDLLKELKSA